MAVVAIVTRDATAERVAMAAAAATVGTATGTLRFSVFEPGEMRKLPYSKRSMERPLIVGADATDAEGSPLKRPYNGTRMMWFADPHEITGPGTTPGDNPFHHLVPRALRFHPPCPATAPRLDELSYASLGDMLLPDSPRVDSPAWNSSSDPDEDEDEVAAATEAAAAVETKEEEKPAAAAAAAVAEPAKPHTNPRFPPLFIFFVHGVKHGGVSLLRGNMKTMLSDLLKAGGAKDKLKIVNVNPLLGVARHNYRRRGKDWQGAVSDACVKVGRVIRNTTAKVLVLMGEMFVLPPSTRDNQPGEIKERIEPVVLSKDPYVVNECEKRSAGMIHFTYVTHEEDLARSIRQACFKGCTKEASLEHSRVLAAIYNKEAIEKSKKYDYVPYSPVEVRQAIARGVKLSLE